MEGAGGLVGKIGLGRAVGRAIFPSRSPADKHRDYLKEHIRENKKRIISKKPSMIRNNNLKDCP